MGLLALILAVFALFCCIYLWLELQKKLSSEDVASKLSQSSEELSKNYARNLREIETEWADMYSKFSRLVGRIDKVRALESPPENQKAAPALTRSDLLRRRKGGMHE